PAAGGGGARGVHDSGRRQRPAASSGRTASAPAGAGARAAAGGPGVPVLRRRVHNRCGGCRTDAEREALLGAAPPEIFSTPIAYLFTYGYNHAPREFRGRRRCNGEEEVRAG